MAFRFKLVKPTVPAGRGDQLGGVEPLEDAEDYEYLIIRGCADLAQTDARFDIGGFGDSDWNFDIAYDMSAFMENLADLLAAVKSRSNFELNLYPQGVERTLDFSFVGDVVSVRCTSRTSWQPSIPVEIIDYAEFCAMCTELARDFSGAVSLVGSQVADLAPFCHWRHGDFSC